MSEIQLVTKQFSNLTQSIMKGVGCDAMLFGKDVTTFFCSSYLAFSYVKYVSQHMQNTDHKIRSTVSIKLLHVLALRRGAILWESGRTKRFASPTR